MSGKKGSKEAPRRHQSTRRKKAAAPPGDQLHKSLLSTRAYGFQDNNRLIAINKTGAFDGGHSRSSQVQSCFGKSLNCCDVWMTSWHCLNGLNQHDYPMHRVDIIRCVGLEQCGFIRLHGPSLRLTTDEKI
eukprot:6492581-Amphidinium_carterae.2